MLLKKLKKVTRGEKMLDGKIDTSFNFSWNNAAHLAWCSAFAYNQPLTGRKLAKECGYKECKFFDKDGAQGYGLATDKYIVIALRGTEPKEKSDVVADLKAWKSSSKYQGRVHAGFKDEVMKIMDQIDKFVAKHEGKKIYVCGHSLGAAMATIVTTRLKNKPEAVYTYGSPRVGNRKFAHHFDKDYTCYRFVNNNDIVTAVPGPIMYDHVGKLHYISYKKTIHTGMGTNPLRRFWDKLRGLLRAWRKGEIFDHVYDHDITRYAKIISAKAESSPPARVL